MFGEKRTRALLIILGGVVAVTFLTWAWYFWRQSGVSEVPSGPEAAPLSIETPIPEGAAEMGAEVGRESEGVAPGLGRGGAVLEKEPELIKIFSFLKSPGAKIDLDFFESAIFKSLEDLRVQVEPPIAIGRPNPFAPFKEKTGVVKE